MMSSREMEEQEERQSFENGDMHLYTAQPDLAPEVLARTPTMDLLGIGETKPAGDEPQKVTITIHHKDQDYRVSWDTDTTPKDIQEAILCACDAIIDSGFDLEDSTGHLIDIRRDGLRLHELMRNGEVYSLVKGEEKKEFSRILGDRLRRIRVECDPLRHAESIKAIERMRQGANILKHTRTGYPHMRQFQLSADLGRLLWYTSSKSIKEASIQFKDVCEVRLGQTTRSFKRYKLPMLSHLSFSLIFKNDMRQPLDLTAKDEYEFDLWVTGVKALMYHWSDRLIAKLTLLNHSRRFNDLLQKNNLSSLSTALMTPPPKASAGVTLDDCIDMGSVTFEQLEKKAKEMDDRLHTVQVQIRALTDITPDPTANDVVPVSSLMSPIYEEIMVNEEDAEDLATQYARMMELLDQVVEGLRQVRKDMQEYKSSGGTKLASSRPDSPVPTNASPKLASPPASSGDLIQKIDSALWKAEVDLENVEDIFKRMNKEQKRTTAAPDMLEGFKNFMKKLSFSG
eukprot:GILK01005686.1.p1 GENE.GILK01005686.1~~GILK01005686.1.p1  ORF type:complete len:512 (-),score=123.18 GILK01005686.1:189-1724(-)